MVQTWLKQRSTIGMQQIQVASSVLVRQHGEEEEQHREEERGQMGWWVMCVCIKPSWNHPSVHVFV